MIKGITVILYTETQSGTDDFNRPIMAETAEAVDNVLVAPSTEQELLETTNLTGRKAVYTLGIPKGDTHDWVDKKVSFFGQNFRTIGQPIEGIDAMIPLQWNKKVRCEIYDG